MDRVASLHHRQCRHTYKLVSNNKTMIIIVIGIFFRSSLDANKSTPKLPLAGERHKPVQEATLMVTATTCSLRMET